MEYNSIRFAFVIKWNMLLDWFAVAVVVVVLAVALCIMFRIVLAVVF